MKRKNVEKKNEFGKKYTSPSNEFLLHAVNVEKKKVYKKMWKKKINYEKCTRPANEFLITPVHKQWKNVQFQISFHTENQP